MRKIYSIILVFLSVHNFSSAQDMYLPPPPPNELFSTTIEEYKRMKLEEKRKLDSVRLMSDLQRIKAQAEIQRLYRAGNAKKEDPTAVSIEVGLEKLRSALNPDDPTLRAQAVPMDHSNAADNHTTIDAGVAQVDTNAAATSQPQQTYPGYVQNTTKAIPTNEKNFSRFANSPCFQTLGYIPDDPGLEDRYRRCEESKLKDQIAKVSLWVVIVAGLLGTAWYAFKAVNPSKGSKTSILR
jgi:hypothetical protein